MKPVRVVLIAAALVALLISSTTAARITGPEAGGGAPGAGAPTTAEYVTISADGGLSNEYVLGTQVIMTGTTAGRPAASKNGLLYFDSDAGILYRDTGATWVAIAPAILHKNTHVSGGSDAFVSADVIEAVVKRLQTTTGPTTLAMGAVADGEFLKRVGTDIVGAAGTGSGAPTNATYITQTADGTLSNEQALSALGTGLVKNTTTTGVLSIYAGTSCTNQFPRSLDASGAATCASVANTDLVNSSVTINGSAVSLGGSKTLTLASADFANQGTTTTVLHGNAAGNPSFAAISPTADISGWPANASGCLSNNGSGTLSWGACSGGGSNVTRLMVSGSDFTTSSVSLSDVTGLTMSLAANTNYSFVCRIYYTTNSTTVGSTLAINGPTSPTIFIAHFQLNTSATSETATYAMSSTYDTGVANTTGPGASTAYGVADGSIHNGANTGTFAVRWASETATLTTVLQGSHCIVTKD